MADCEATLYKMASLTKRPGPNPSIVFGQPDEHIMKIDVKIEASPNERRRLLGRANIAPVIEVVSILFDGIAMASVNARLAALESEGFVDGRQDGR